MSGGGAQRVASRLANALVENNEVTIVALVPSKEIYVLDDRVRLLFLKEPVCKQFPVRGRFGAYLNYLCRVLDLRRQVKRIKLEERPDVALSMLDSANLLNAFSRTKGCRTVTSERNNPRRKGKKYYLKGCLSYLKSDMVVFQSRTVMRQFPLLIRRKGVVVPNPIQVSCKADGCSKRIVTMGRLNPQKNHTLLLKAFALFAKDHPLHTLHIYGKAYEWDDIGYTHIINDLCLSDKAFLEGHREDVHSLIADAEQFVLSSDFEGTPNALLEAMMMGLPCISTAFEGAKELFGDSEACCLTPVGDENNLAKAMASVADDVVFRQRLACRGKSFADSFSMEKVIPQWLKVLFA